MLQHVRDTVAAGGYGFRLENAVGVCPGRSIAPIAYAVEPDVVARPVSLALAQPVDVDEIVVRPGRQR